VIRFFKGGSYGLSMCFGDSRYGGFPMIDVNKEPKYEWECELQKLQKLQREHDAMVAGINRSYRNRMILLGVVVVLSLVIMCFGVW
jgi:hypothetical protein